MTPQQIVAVGIRLVAIWLAAASFKYFVLVPAELEGMNLDGQFRQAYAIAAGYAAAAVLLWMFPMWTAHKLVSRTRFENTLAVNAAEAARVGCALIGLWLLVQGLLNAVWYLFLALLFPGSESAFDSLGHEAQLDFIVTLATLAAGLALVLGAGRFAALVVRGAAPQVDAG